MRYGADAIINLSTGEDINAIRARLLKVYSVMMGSVLIYQTGLTAARRNAVVEMTKDNIFNGIEKHTRDGMDFMTIYCGITKRMSAGRRSVRGSPTWSPRAVCS